MSDSGDQHASLADRTRARVVSGRRVVVERTRDALLVVPALDLVWELARRYRRLNGSVLAGHITYRLFLWLAPLVLLLVAAFGYGMTADLGLDNVINEAGLSEDTGQTFVDQASTSSLYVFWIGLVGLLLASYGLLKALHYVFAQAWEVEIVPRRGIVAAIVKFIGATLIVMLVLLVIAAARDQGVLLRAGAAAGSFVMYGVIGFTVTWIMPRRSSSVVDLLPGAVLIAVGASVLHAFAQYYIPYKVTESSQVYGTLGAVFAVLFYLWCLAMLLVGAALCDSVWTDRATILAGRPMIADPDRLSPRLRRTLFRLGAWSSRAGEAAVSVEARVRRPSEPGEDAGEAGSGTGTGDVASDRH